MIGRYRLLWAALAGAAVMFVWSALSHTMLIRGIGFTPLPNEDRLVVELKESIKEDGLYFFPGIDWDREPTDEEAAAWEARYRAGNGILVYHPSSDGTVTPRKLGLQLFGDALAALLAAYVVSLVNASYWRRLSVVAALGTFGCVGVSALYWNWYGFSHAFFVAHCFDKIVGWTLAGAAIARLSPSSARAAPSSPPVATR
jgi:hypothetical protein